MKDAEELLAVVDENDKHELAPQPRTAVRSQGLWRRSTHVWVVNREGNILCHQRSLDKDSNPGKWTPHFGGHNHPGESYEAAALRELREETGIKSKKEQLRYYKTHKWSEGHKLQAVYLLIWNGSITGLKIDKSEVEQVRWVKPTKLAIAVHSGGWTNFGYEEELLSSLNQGALKLV